MATVIFASFDPKARTATFLVNGERVTREVASNVGRKLPHAVTREVARLKADGSPVLMKDGVTPATYTVDATELRVHTLDDHLRSLAEGLAIEADAAEPVNLETSIKPGDVLVAPASEP